MADFSIGDALGSGFGLIRRRPISVLVWGLVTLIVGMVIPVALFGSGLSTDYMNLFRNFGPGMVAMPPERMMQLMAPLQAKLMLLDPIILVIGLLLRAVLTGAVFRAVLEPRNRGLAYLRLGGRELWLALLNFVAQVLAAFLIIALAVVGLILGFILNAVFEAQHVAWAARGAAFAAIGLVIFAVFIGICVRFSLAWPMTFADGKFRLFESWSLTRRHGWKLFGLALLICVICALAVMLFEAVAAVLVIMAAGGAHWDPLAVMGLMQNPQAMLTPGFIAGLVVGGLVGSWLIGVVSAISMAPWAVAYRELLPPPPAPPGAVFAEPAPGPPAGPAPVAEDHDHGHADPHANADQIDDGHGHQH